MSILSKDELESLDMSRILKELTPLEEKLLEAYKELEDGLLREELEELSQAKEELEEERGKNGSLQIDFERVCDENAALRVELEEANKLVNSLRAKLDKTKDKLEEARIFGR